MTDLALPDDKTLSFSLFQNESRDHPPGGDALHSFSSVTKRCDRKAALKFLRKLMKRYGQPYVIVDGVPKPGNRKSADVGVFEALQ